MDTYLFPWRLEVRGKVKHGFGLKRLERALDEAAAWCTKYGITTTAAEIRRLLERLEEG